MKILFVTQYFPPEIGAGAIRVHEMCKEWVAQGHDITVLTGFPNYPTGNVPREYKRKIWKLIHIENIDGIRIIHTWLYPTDYRGALVRILNYLSFLISASFTGMFVHKPDIVLATSPPLLVGLAGYWISFIKRVPFIFDVRDLWPESLVIADEINQRNLVFNCLKHLSKFLYRHSAKVVVVTDGFKKELIDHYNLHGDRIAIIKNGVDLTFFKPNSNNGKTKKDLGFDQKFVVSYFGSIGISHGVENILACAKCLLDHREILFLIVGEGARKHVCLKLKEDDKLDNVQIWDNQPREKIPELINASNVFLVSHINAPVFNTFIPSKMFEGMACEIPLLAAVAGDAAEIVNASKAGIVVERENPKDMADAIIRLYENQSYCDELGSNGLEFVRTNFSRQQLANHYLEIIQNTIIKGS